MSRRPKTVLYCFNNEEKKTLKIDYGATVGDFLHKVMQEERNSDICAVYFRGRQLDMDDLILNHVKGKYDVLIVSDDPDKTPADFVDADVPIPDEAEDISKSLRDSMRKTDDTPKDIFTKKNAFKIFTTANSHSFLNGDKVTILSTDDFETISDKIKSLVQSFEEEDIPEDFEIHIFLPGGVPFLSGLISQYFDSTDITHNHLYVVVTKNLGDKINKTIKEPCNCSEDFVDALSPLCESSEAGLTQIACFLGYIFHHGLYAEHLLQVLAKVTRFVPLITNYFRLLENAPITFLNIIAITGPLFAFFKSLIPNDKPSDSVFEYTLKIVSFIGLLNEIEYLHIHTIDWEEETDDVNEADLRDYLKETGQQKHIVIWEIDTNHPEFKGFNINDTEFDKIEEIFDAVSTFKPVPPLSLHYIYFPTFIRSSVENNVLLFLREVPNKKKFIKYIDPHVGKAQTENIEELSRKLHCDEKENGMDLIDHSRVEQINVICFDKSKSMKFQLKGGNCIHGEDSRAQLSSDFLRALIEQSYKFRVSSIYGLISFGSEVKTLQKLTPMSSEFIEKLKEIEPKGNTLLWDAIKEAKEQIHSIITPEEEDEEEEVEYPYPNAHSRIIVITDGTDNKSSTDPVKLANELIKENIIVDTVLVSLDKLNNDCCALSKLTGGLCFRPNDKASGLKIFEQEAFLNITSRHLSGPSLGSKDVTQADFTEASTNFESFDTIAENQELINAKTDFPLSEPLYMCYQYKTKDPETIRKKRALLELNVIGHHPDDNYKVYSSHANPIEWRIFIKGPEGTPFEEKWLNIFMTLPNEYPFSPPKFRFLTVPFHPNISSEGIVVFSLVDKNYSSDANIGDIIQGIIQLLGEPEEDSPINLEAMTLYLDDDKSAYEAKQESGETGVDDYHEFIQTKVFSEIPKDVEIPEDTRNNLYMTNANASFRGKIIEDDDDHQYDDDD